MENRIRVLISKVGLDGHDRGAKIVAQMLKDAGMEVVYLGRFQSPKGIMDAALQEGVDVIGLSYLSGGQLSYTPEILELKRKYQMDDVKVIIGGIFPKEEIPKLKEMGVDEVFMDSNVQSIVDYIRTHVKK
jgi:methylmalonyl-CoA mutase C-terminal domain/subunit